MAVLRSLVFVIQQLARRGQYGHIVNTTIQGDVFLDSTIDNFYKDGINFRNWKNVVK